ncbi:MAG: glycine cleavage system protein H [Planctomycetales bacterium]|nr:glycine cleavage system protein H [Planctomycetales bacterium]
MPVDPAETIYYRQSRFTTRLPKNYLFVPSHYWLSRLSEGRYRVGLTRFATRMLGDFVECEFQVASGDSVELGEPIGWIEGFKALADLYCTSGGRFMGGNTRLQSHPQLLDNDPYDAGWLYELACEPPPNAVDAEGYAGCLDVAIRRMLDQESQKDDSSC